MNQSSLINKTEKEKNQFQDLLEKYGNKKKISKGSKIITQGAKSAFFFYVISGAFKSYISHGDREYILGFSFSDFIDCCPYSLFSNNLNTYSIEAIMNSEVIVVSLSDLEKFTKGNNGFEDFTHKSLIDYIGEIENILFELISKTAEERYMSLCKENGLFIKQLSLSDLAKYLGISLERLSRIRKKNGML